MASDTSWMRNREGLGVWEHRGKVAIVGWGHSPTDRRWDGVTMDRSCGGLSKEACLKAIADAGLSLDDIDGLITSAETRAANLGAAAVFRPAVRHRRRSDQGVSGVDPAGVGVQERQVSRIRCALHRSDDGPGRAGRR